MSSRSSVRPNPAASSRRGSLNDQPPPGGSGGSELTGVAATAEAGAGGCTAGVPALPAAPGDSRNAASCAITASSWLRTSAVRFCSTTNSASMLGMSSSVGAAFSRACFWRRIASEASESGGWPLRSASDVDNVSRGEIGAPTYESGGGPEAEIVNRSRGACGAGCASRARGCAVVRRSMARGTRCGAGRGSLLRVSVAARGARAAAATGGAAVGRCVTAAASDCCPAAVSRSAAEFDAEMLAAEERAASSAVIAAGRVAGVTLTPAGPTGSVVWAGVSIAGNGSRSSVRSRRSVVLHPTSIETRTMGSRIARELVMISRCRLPRFSSVTCAPVSCGSPSLATV